MLDQVAKILIDEKKLMNRVQELGKQISEDYEGKDLVVICILKGAIMFTADLVKAISLPVHRFYGGFQLWQFHKILGVVRILKDLDEEIEAARPYSGGHS